MSKLKFLKKFFLNRKEIWAITPSSRFLAKKVILENDIKNSEVILEMWAWTGSFTQKIFEFIWENKENKKIFIIEKDKDLFFLLQKKFPE